MLDIEQTEEYKAALAIRLAVKSLERKKREQEARRAQWPKGTQEFAERFRHFSLPTPWFHVEWYKAYDDPALTNIYVMGPREHAKTSTVLSYVTRVLAENQALRVGIISGTDPLAIKFLKEVRYEFEANEELREVYNDGESFKGDQWTDHEIVLNRARKLGMKGKDVSLFAIGRGGQISSRHCDVLIVDDVESADSVRSELVRQATREWWSREVTPVLSKDGKFIVVGTRKHYDDIYSRLTPAIGWRILDVAKQVWKEDGEPIWPEMWSKPALLARKAQLDENDILAWPQEYLNLPLPSESQMFYPDKWPVYHKVPHGLTILQAWDLAISERTTADYTVGWTIGVDENNNVYLLERRRGHWDFNRTLAEIAQMGQAWPDVQAIGIEKVAYQAAAIQEALRRTMLPIIPIDITKDRDKVTRARLLEARANAGKVYRPADTNSLGLPKEANWWPSFAQEAVYFPASAHDDQIDALAHAVRMAGSGSSAVAWQYGVWTCTNCGHMFMFEPGRECPRCGTKAPETFENPELLDFGALDRGLSA